MITLEHGRLRLALLPELGASIAAFHDGDFPLLRDTPPRAIAGRDGRAFSCFPLIPYSNRIRHARFTFAGSPYELRHDAEDPRHALHGTARFHPWRLCEHGATHALCTLDFTGPRAEWPFSYRAWQRFTLEANRLTVALGLCNTEHKPAPAGLGLHPYFPRHGDVALQFAAGYVWAKDGEDIPVRSMPEAQKFDFSSPRPIRDHEAIDHAYGGWKRHAYIAWPAHGRRLTLAADGIFRDLVIYTPAAQDYFACEPVTHRPDALNPNGDPRDAPMTILQPGERIEGRVSLELG